jgi:hypothetical protein
MLEYWDDGTAECWTSRTAIPTQVSDRTKRHEDAAGFSTTEHTEYTKLRSRCQQRSPGGWGEHRRQPPVDFSVVPLICVVKDVGSVLGAALDSMP